MASTALKTITVHTLGCSRAIADSVHRLATSIAATTTLRHYLPAASLSDDSAVVYADADAVGGGKTLMTPSAAYEVLKEKRWVACCLDDGPLTPVLDEMECLISDCPLGPESPHVYHALYRQAIPVLCLRNPLGPAAWPRSEQRPRHPLYEDALSLAAADSDDAIAKFLLGFNKTSASRGKVIVIEGGDGAGKQTQCLLLLNRLRCEGYQADSLDFPHDAGHCGEIIRILLSGKIGGLREVNPLMFASLYSMNRHDKLPWIKHWLQRGTHVVMDRYMSANFGHQASKYDTAEERNKIIGILRTFEIQWLRLPQASMVLYLNLPPLFAWKALQADTTRVLLDMHEKAGIDYKAKVQEAFLWCCAEFQAEGWREVKCVDEKEETRLSREALHASIFAKVQAMIRGENDF